jgi:hypothetical protein
MNALMMEAGSPSETSVNIYQTTRRYNPEDSRLLVCLIANQFSAGQSVLYPYICFVLSGVLCAFRKMFYKFVLLVYPILNSFMQL